MTSWHFLLDKCKHLSSNNHLDIEPFFLKILLFHVGEILDISFRKNFWALPDLEIVKERDPLKLLLSKVPVKKQVREQVEINSLFWNEVLPYLLYTFAIPLYCRIHLLVRDQFFLLIQSYFNISFLNTLFLLLGKILQKKQIFKFLAIRAKIYIHIKKKLNELFKLI